MACRFTYIPPSADRHAQAILKYISREKDCADDLKNALKKCGFMLVNLSSKEILLELGEIPDLRKKLSFERDCINCIENFFSKYSSWNEKLKGISASAADQIVALLSEYDSKCFVQWHSHSVLISGTKAAVDEVKGKIEICRLNSGNDRLTQTAPLHSFDYSKMNSLLLRFLLQQGGFMANVTEKMEDLASVEISKQHENLFIRLNPNRSNALQCQSGFERSCTDRLDSFFNLFDACTCYGKFSRSDIASQQEKFSKIFRRFSQTDYIVHWSLDTGTVTIAGFSEQVQSIQKMLENELSVSMVLRKLTVEDSDIQIQSSGTASHLPQAPDSFSCETPVNFAQASRSNETSNLMEEEASSSKHGSHRLSLKSYPGSEMQTEGSFCTPSFAKRRRFSASNDSVHEQPGRELNRIASSDTSLGLFKYPRGIHPMIMEFLMMHKHFQHNISTEMHDAASVEIRKERGTPFIYLRSKQNITSAEEQRNFERICEERVTAFIHRFDVCTRRSTFSSPAFAAQKTIFPEIFENADFVELSTRWFLLRTVFITGNPEQVHLFFQLLEDVLGDSESSDFSMETNVPKNYQASAPGHFAPPSSPSYLYGPAAPRFGFPPLFHLPPVPLLPPPFPTFRQFFAPPPFPNHIPIPRFPPVTEFRCREISLDMTGIAYAIQKFVFNDAELRKELEHCWTENARISIKREKNQIKVFAKIKSPNTSGDEEAASGAVRKYFEKFKTITMKLPKNEISKALKRHPELFCSSRGAYVNHFCDTATVKITGFANLVSEKKSEIDDEIFAVSRKMAFRPDILTVLRECNVVTSVEKQCKEKKLTITLKSGHVKFRGQLATVSRAQQLLKQSYENLFKKTPEGLTDDQISFLWKCEGQTNVLNPVYKAFGDKSVHGAVTFEDSTLELVSVDASEWKKGSDILAQLIINFEVDLLKASLQERSTAKLYQLIKKRLEGTPVHVKYQDDSARLQAYCLEGQKAQMRSKITEIVDDLYHIFDVDRFYEMPEELAQHICNPHISSKIYMAKSMKQTEQNGQSGLLVTCEKEDVHAVDDSVEEIKQSSTKISAQIFGFSLYECLMSDNKHFSIEHQTKCSIFLKPMDGKAMKSAVTAQVGNIMDETSDAIVNSTGSSLSLTGLLSQALAAKYGTDELKNVVSKGRWILKNQVQLCSTNGKFPWKYILNVATPNSEDDLTEFLLELLKVADKEGICSISLPTIGTGIQGMDPIIVARCMKEAFHSFASQDVANLKSVRVIVFDQSMLPIFQDVALLPQAPKSAGVAATIYSGDLTNINKALEKLKEICETIVTNATINRIPSSVKIQVGEICLKHNVYIEWNNKGGSQNCRLQGATSEVKAAEEDIKKLLNPDVPLDWCPVDNSLLFTKEKLTESSKEYAEVQRKFDVSKPAHAKIVKIERIQNPSLYKQFRAKKESIARNCSRGTITQRLFHGTLPTKVDSICGNGFDRNFAGENGTAYGRGAYFAVNSAYSCTYTGHQSTRCLFLADVITGDYTLGRSEYKAPPEKGNGKVLYDSVVNNIANPTIFVVFRDASAYPTYLITYQ